MESQKPSYPPGPAPPTYAEVRLATIEGRAKTVYGNIHNHPETRRSAAWIVLTAENADDTEISAALSSTRYSKVTLERCARLLFDKYDSDYEWSELDGGATQSYRNMAHAILQAAGLLPEDNGEALAGPAPGQEGERK